MAQIIEDYVSFETAKLLKEKGFDEICYLGYNKNGEYVPTNNRCNSQIIQPDFCLICCPTLQMAMKWLREVHGLFISIEPCFDYESKHVVYLAFIQNVTDIDIFQEGRVEVASGYIVEAVYGKALKYCLENLI